MTSRMTQKYRSKFAANPYYRVDTDTTVRSTRFDPNLAARTSGRTKGADTASEQICTACTTAVSGYGGLTKLCNFFHTGLCSWVVW